MDKKHLDEIKAREEKEENEGYNEKFNPWVWIIAFDRRENEQHGNRRKAMNNIIERLKQAYSADKAETLNLLPQLFKAADDGKIIELPCKLGGKLYTIDEFTDGTSDPKILELDRNIMMISKNGFGEIEYILDRIYSKSDFGKTVFGTREEAEKALKEREISERL